MSVDLGAQFQAMFQTVLVPGRWLLEHVGMHPIDMQVWALYVAVFMLALGGASTYSDVILMRRQMRTTGTVTGIDRDDVDTPRISFRAADGESYEFASTLPLNFGTATIGNSVAVVYDPLNPRRAREAGRPIAKGVAIVVLYGVAVAILAYAIAGGALN